MPASSLITTVDARFTDRRNHITSHPHRKPLEQRYMQPQPLPVIAARSCKRAKIRSSVKVNIEHCLKVANMPAVCRTC